MLKAIIIDDEPHAREKMKMLLERFCKNVELVAIEKTARDGLQAIQKQHPDLLFLDIEMPEETGFDLLKQIERIDFEIIFTTAHDHYAIKAIKFSALDYLLKPIDPEQLTAAVEKAETRRLLKKSVDQYQLLKENLSKEKEPLEQLAVPAQTGMIFIKVNDILYCEADSNYTHIHLANKTRVVSSRTLKDYDELLSENGFIRIHHGHLVNRKYIATYVKGEGGQVILTNGISLAVSRRKKEEVLRELKTKK